MRLPKLSAVRLAGELNKKPTDSASLDELLQRIKEQLTKLGPIIDLEWCGSRGVENGARRDRGASNHRALPALRGLRRAGRGPPLVNGGQRRRPYIALAEVAGAVSAVRRTTCGPWLWRNERPRNGGWRRSGNPDGSVTSST